MAKLHHLLIFIVPPPSGPGGKYPPPMNHPSRSMLRCTSIYHNLSLSLFHFIISLPFFHALSFLYQSTYNHFLSYPLYPSISLFSTFFTLYFSILCSSLSLSLWFSTYILEKQLHITVKQNITGNHNSRTLRKIFWPRFFAFSLSLSLLK